jgi:hypothetical protein
MKNKLLLSLSIVALLFLSACDGSDTYRGKWKGTDSEGTHYEITFKENSFIVNEKGGKSKEFGYSQNSININNSITTYGIQLDDGRVYQITFPIANNETRGIMKDANGKLLYTICRDKYIAYEDIYNLK